ncbi:MAG: rhodanese-like domain-containing protein [Dehalococcoidales bacterium]|nr:rhodanese-like domain-containing protein [Dehalococcoidales bacterium]
MNFKNMLSLVLMVSLVTGLPLLGACAGQSPVATQPEGTVPMPGNVTPQQAFTLIQENQDNPDFVILDVRTPEEFADAHIENAININFYSETFRDELNRLDRNKIYLVYCASSNRSTKALTTMSELGFKEAYNMLGGMGQWESEGLPTIK